MTAGSRQPEKLNAAEPKGAKTKEQKRQEAEERANKVGVKLVFPIFFFILPSMLVVSAGPGLLQVFKYLFPLMKGANVGQ